MGTAVAVAAESPENGAQPSLTSAEPRSTSAGSRRRMLSARRRLLGMLIALEGAAISLAVLGMAALWVVIPPSVMFAGYLLLLREAAHADAERALREEEAALARARARAHARARARARAERSGAGGPAVAAGAASRASAAGPADRAPGYEDAGPGRDFAPGLAGKYTTSNAEVIPISEQADEDAYEDYTRNNLRAVGD